MMEDELENIVQDWESYLEFYSFPYPDKIEAILKKYRKKKCLNTKDFRYLTNQYIIWEVDVYCKRLRGLS
jgi:hypothetical protein